MNKKEKLVNHSILFSILLGFLCLISALIMLIPVYYLCLIIFSITTKVDHSIAKTNSILVAVCLLVTTLIKLALSLANIILGFKTRKARKLDLNQDIIKKYNLTTMIFSIILVVALLIPVIFNLTIPFVRWLDLAISILLVCNIVLIILNLKSNTESSITENTNNNESN